MKLFLKVLSLCFFISFPAEAGECIDTEQGFYSDFLPDGLLSVEATSLNVGAFKISYDSDLNLWIFGKGDELFGYYHEAKKKWFAFKNKNESVVVISVKEKGSKSKYVDPNAGQLLAMDSLWGLYWSFHNLEDFLKKRNAPTELNPFGEMLKKGYRVSFLKNVELNNDSVIGHTRVPVVKWNMGVLDLEKNSKHLRVLSSVRYRENIVVGDNEFLNTRMPINGHHVVSLSNEGASELSSLRVIRFSEMLPPRKQKADVAVELSPSKFYYSVDCKPVESFKVDSMGRSPNSESDKKMNTLRVYHDAFRDASQEPKKKL